MTEIFREIPVVRDGHAGYTVTVGRQLTNVISESIPGDARKVLIVHPPVLHARAEALREALSGSSREVFLAEVPDGEATKRLEVAGFVWGLLGQLDFSRTDAVLGFGGGATTDLAGFVAATWLRGVPVVQVPTTVLGMVDAAVGGKTGINTAEGKNLVGSFHAPAAVVVDAEYATTLPENEVRTGFAEIIKCGFIRDPEILDLIEASPDTAVDVRTDVFLELVSRAIQVKAEVVSADFTESGLREILNYGHTLGHAIEHAERYQWRHGAAISIGMVFAAELSRMVAGLSDDQVERHRRIFSHFGLPIDYPAGRWGSLLATMQKDKKSRGGVLRFVVLDGVGKPRVLAIPDESILLAAYDALHDHAD
jgi:3-dehydroquinate synthase